MRRWLLCVLALAAACGDSTSPRVTPTFTITPSAQWSAGVVVLRSESFRGALPTVTGAGDTLDATRIDDSTVSVVLPESPSGAVSLFREGATRDAIGTVQVFGLRNARLVPGTLGYEPLVPAGVFPLVFVAESMATAGQDLAVFDPATDQVSYLSGIGPVQSAFGVMPSYQPNRFVVRDSADQLGVWHLFPTPAFEYTSVVQNLASRTVTQLNDSTWLTVTSNNLFVSRPSGTFSPGGGVSDPLRVVFSPSGHRVALVVSFSPTQQLPVLDGATGELAFAVSLPSSQGAAFGVLSNRLYLSSRQASAPDTLVSLSASTGQFAAGTTLPAGYSGWMLAPDPVANRLYQVADSSGKLAVLVYNGTTLALEGRLTCAPGCGNSNYWSAGMGVDVAAGRIHVAYPGAPIPVVTFDRLP
jgi:hypothetical protein